MTASGTEMAVARVRAETKATRRAAEEGRPLPRDSVRRGGKPVPDQEVERAEARLHAAGAAAKPEPPRRTPPLHTAGSRRRPAAASRTTTPRRR